MTLLEMLDKLDTLNDELVICAKKQAVWTADSPAALCTFDNDACVVDIPDGFVYFLEVFIAKEVVDVWSDWKGRKPNLEEKCGAVIYYAENDAYIGS